MTSWLGDDDEREAGVIVDCHAHLLPPRRTDKLIEWTLRFNPAHPVPFDVTLDALLEGYRFPGVERIWNFAHALFPPSGSWPP